MGALRCATLYAAYAAIIDYYTPSASHADGRLPRLSLLATPLLPRQFSRFVTLRRRQRFRYVTPPVYALRAALRAYAAVCTAQYALGAACMRAACRARGDVTSELRCQHVAFDATPRLPRQDVLLSSILRLPRAARAASHDITTTC